MKTKSFSVVIALLLVCIGAKAQDKSRSLTVSFAPLGYNHVSIKSSESYQYDYKSYWNASIGYEKQLKGIVSLTEFTYSHADFDKSELKGTPTQFDPTQEVGLTIASITTYAGKTINPNKRVQFPVYIGIGADYTSGGFMHNLVIDVALKARMKFYITNNFGIFAGATGRIGYGLKKASVGYNETDYYNLVLSMWAIDAGLVFGI